MPNIKINVVEKNGDVWNIKAKGFFLCSLSFSNRKKPSLTEFIKKYTYEKKDD